ELVQSFGSDDAVEIGGPPLALRGRSVELLALAIHELAVNAVKFGALANRGRVSVTWEERAGAQGRLLALTWAEENVPTLENPRRRGFGLELIERGLPYELEARVD